MFVVRGSGKRPRRFEKHIARSPKLVQGAEQKKSLQCEERIPELQERLHVSWTSSTGEYMMHNIYCASRELESEFDRQQAKLTYCTKNTT